MRKMPSNIEIKVESKFIIEILNASDIINFEKSLL